jgi:hypothetical protein
MTCHFGGEDAMLQITVHEDGTFCGLELAGRLAGSMVLEIGRRHDAGFPKQEGL